MKRNILFLTFFILIQALFCNEIYKSNVVISYYGDDFNGKQTSAGEIFNMNDFTCAHKTLPFNTILEITNLKNNKSVKVRVNDRGPFVVGRELDISKAAAQKLEMTKEGTCIAKIEIVKLGENTKLSEQTALSAAKIMESKGEKNSTALPKMQSKNENFYDIQIGSYSTKDAANKVAQKMLKQGFKNLVFQKTSKNVRVVIKKVSEENLAEIEEKLLKNGYSDYLIRNY